MSRDRLALKNQQMLPAGKNCQFFSLSTTPTGIQDINKKIFSEWLPNCKDYEIAAGYNIEMYGNPAEYQKGVQDENTTVSFGFL